MNARKAFILSFGALWFSAIVASALFLVFAIFHRPPVAKPNAEVQRVILEMQATRKLEMWIKPEADFMRAENLKRRLVGLRQIDVSRCPADFVEAWSASLDASQLVLREFSKGNGRGWANLTHLVNAYFDSAKNPVLAIRDLAGIDTGDSEGLKAAKLAVKEAAENLQRCCQKYS